MNKQPLKRMTIDSYLEELAGLIKVDRAALSVGQRVPGMRWDKLEPATNIHHLQIGEDPNSYQVRVMLNRGVSVEPYLVPVTQFKLIKFPGCCAFAISMETFVFEEFQRKGVNTLTNLLRQEIARWHGFTSLICTDREDNVPERKTLLKLGWKDIYQVDNDRTGNLINISVKEL